jgi:uncharacterized coiled-coil DUF342 family protein
MQPKAGSSGLRSAAAEVPLTKEPAADHAIRGHAGPSSGAQHEDHAVRTAKSVSPPVKLFDEGSQEKKSISGDPALGVDAGSHEESFAKIIRPSMFWSPERRAPSAWTEHVPFAFWLVDALRPRTIVELGTEHGVSYSAMCQAVKSLNLPTSCFAIDTWKGDEYTGSYSDDVYQEFAAFHDARYTAFSRLVRSTFDEALDYFEDGSVDLLHIDGFHTYEAVRHDFDSWLPKLSPDAVVLFHDINVRENKFGVFRLWSEITAGQPHFAFLHGHGIGVLGRGSRYPNALRHLFAASEDDELCGHLRQTFASLGRSVRLENERAVVDRAATEHAKELEAIKNELDQRGEKIIALEQALSQRDNELDGLRNELAQRGEKVGALDQALSQRDNELDGLRNELAQRGEKVGALDQALSQRTSELDELRKALARSDEKMTVLEQALSRRRDELRELRNELTQQVEQARSAVDTANKARRGLAASSDEVVRLRAVVAEATTRAAELMSVVDARELELTCIKRSISWRVTRPLRAIGRIYPRLVRLARQPLKFLWSPLTLQLWRGPRARRTHVKPEHGDNRTRRR